MPATTSADDWNVNSNKKMPTARRNRRVLGAGAGAGPQSSLRPLTTTDTWLIISVSLSLSLCFELFRVQLTWWTGYRPPVTKLHLCYTAAMDSFFLLTFNSAGIQTMRPRCSATSRCHLFLAQLLDVDFHTLHWVGAPTQTTITDETAGTKHHHHRQKQKQ